MLLKYMVLLVLMIYWPKVESGQVEALRETITWKIRKIPKIRSTLTLMGIDGQQ